MSISDLKVQRISELAIRVLLKRFESFPEDSMDNRNAPFHEAFLKAFSDKISNKISDAPFFISLSSWLQGLNTSLGQTFFEGVAHILSDGEKKEFTSGRLGNLQISNKQKNNINKIITELSNAEKKPNLLEENQILFISDSTERVNAIDFSADVFIEDDEEIVAIELKSVRPNSGEMRGEKQKILEGKTALFEKYPNKKISFYLGFPFDPTAKTPTGKNKERFMSSIINCNKYFHSDEVLLADELWNFLSGSKNTMEELLKIINDVATVDFMEKYNFLNEKSNRNKVRYIEYLKEWKLFTEIELLNKDDIIRERIKGNKSLIRIYNQQIFNKGNYNWVRYYKLINEIS